jgi:hypothetical protein
MSDGFFVRQGQSSWLNITAATVVKPIPGRIVRVQVLVAGTTVGAIFDSNTLTGNGAPNWVGAAPNTIGSYLIDHPCTVGVTVSPGAGQTLAVTYD